MQDKEYNKALEILNLTEEECWGGLYTCSNISIDQIKDLYEKTPSYLLLDLSYNEAPTGDDFIEFLKEHPNFISEGYFYDKDREITGLMITGIKAKNNDKNTQDLYSFVNKEDADYGQPDEYGVYDGYIRAWWD